MKKEEWESLMQCAKETTPDLYESIIKVEKEKEDFIIKMIDYSKRSVDFENMDAIIKSNFQLSKKEKNILLDVCILNIIFCNPETHGGEEFKIEIDERIEKMRRYRDFCRKKKLHYDINQTLFATIKDYVKKYSDRSGLGRPKGAGKYHFIYNDKDYTTIQSCADDYKISKQAMYKRLKKLNII